MKTLYAGVLALAALLDNVTTWVALENGAVEVNPLVKPFTVNPYLFAFFTVVKAMLAFLIVHQAYENTLRFKISYLAVLALFLNATVLNILNALG